MGVATATALVGAGISAYSAIDAANKKKKAARALENLPTPETSNVAENLTVSTRGADLRKEEAGRTSATAIDALRGAGTRGVIGGIGNVVAENNAVSADVGANLDAQQKDIDRMKAGDNVRIQGINEQRYQSDVAGLSSQIDSAQDAQNQGIANTIQGLGVSDMANSYDVARDKSKGRTTTPTTTVNGSTNQFDTPANRRLVQKTVKKGIRG